MPLADRCGPWEEGDGVSGVSGVSVDDGVLSGFAVSAGALEVSGVLSGFAVSAGVLEAAGVLTGFAVYYWY